MTAPTREQLEAEMMMLHDRQRATGFADGTHALRIEAIRQQLHEQHGVELPNGSDRPVIKGQEQ